MKYLFNAIIICLFLGYEREWLRMYEDILDDSNLIKARTDIRNNYPRNNLDLSSCPQKNLLRRTQDKYGFNKQRKSSQKGLEIRLKNYTEKGNRMNRKFYEERKIRDAFSRKIKNNTWTKRHHNYRYTQESVTD